jgi:hypothetical protein
MFVQRKPDIEITRPMRFLCSGPCKPIEKCVYISFWSWVGVLAPCLVLRLAEKKKESITGFQSKSDAVFLRERSSCQFFLLGINVGTGQGCQMVYFQTQNPNLGYFFEGLGMENVCIFYCLLEYTMAI